MGLSLDSLRSERIGRRSADHKILIIDNEPLVVEELLEFLGGEGFDCVGAVTPEMACDLFLRDPEIDVVLSDFKMPGMTGVQLIETLRTLSQGRIFESIIFTGNAEKNDVIDALRAGVADYYQKPLDLNLLLEGLAKVVAKVEKRSADLKIRTLSNDLKLLSSSLSDIFGETEAGPVASLPVEAIMNRSSGGGDRNALDKLSRRQRDVAMLITKGLTNYQIACDLGISENTVKIYVSQVLRIFNLNNRTQLALVLESKREAAAEHHEN